MKFTLTNVGPIQNAVIDLSRLVVICGPNNAGKTYLTNVISEFYSKIPVECQINVKEQLLDNEEKVTIDLSKYASQIKGMVNEWAVRFSSKSDLLYGGKLEVEVSPEDFRADSSAPDSTWTRRANCAWKFIAHKEGCFLTITRRSVMKDRDEVHAEDESKGLWQDALNRIVNAYLFGQKYNNGAIGDVFAVSSERMGVAFFKDALDIASRAQSHETQEGETHDIGVSDGAARGKGLFPRQIKQMLDFISWMGQRKRMKALKPSAFGEDFGSALDDLAGGSYTIDDGGIVFVPRCSAEVSLSAQEASSSARALFALDSYVRYAAEQGDLLVIDEPEMNLHPDNQRKLARFLAKLVNSGIRVFVTTHSDYFVREINVLMMLNDDDKRMRTVAKRYGYSEDMLLDVAHIKGYRIVDGEAQPMPMSQQQGMEVASFDETIKSQNEVVRDIMFGKD